MRAEQVEEGARAVALGEREALRELVQRQRETDRALVELLLALEEHLRLLQLPPDRLRQLDRLPRAVERLGGVPLRRLELREPRMQGGEKPHLVGPPCGRRSPPRTERRCADRAAARRRERARAP